VRPTEPTRNLAVKGAEEDPRGDVLTAEQVALMLQVRPCTVADWARRGMIPSYKIGKFRRYSKTDVSAWVTARRDTWLDM